MQERNASDRQALMAEAQRIRERVQALKKQWKDSGEQPGLRDEYQRLTNRYRRIEQHLGAGQPDQASPAAPVIDESRLEHRPIAPPVRRPQPGFSFAWDDLAGYFMTGIRSLRVAVTGVLLLFVLTFGYLYLMHDMRFFIVPTRSMQPTLLPMDRIVTTASGDTRRGDIIVFPDPDHPGDYLAKRVVALPGETVAVQNRTLVVDERPIQEPYIAEPMDYRLEPFRVPAGQVFVLGDNRNQSEDSKDWGRGVPIAEIRGRVVMVYAPMNRLHHLSRPATAQAATHPSTPTP